MRHLHVVLRHLAKGRAVMVHPALKHLAPKHRHHSIEHKMEALTLGEGVKHHAHHGKGVHKKRALHYKL